MNALLTSIGYSHWVLPALLADSADRCRRDLDPRAPRSIAAVRRRRGRRPARPRAAHAGAGHLRRRVRRLARPLVELRSRRLRLAVGRRPARGSRRWGIRFTLGVDGIAVMMILLTTFIMLLAVGGSWTSIRDAHAQLLRAAARPHDGHARRVHGARPVPVLRDVGSDARPDVLHHRHLGRRAAHLRERQVLHLHDGRLDAHARGDRVPRCRVRATRCTGHAELQLRLHPGQHAVVSSAAGQVVVRCASSSRSR